MENNIGKKYPRIFSLSTIGLIQHYNVDYIFHPLRTDFSGESGVGKTTIANLLQLIIVGSKYFTPASNSTYNVSGYVLNSKNVRQQNFGYAFVNIEVEKKKYLVIGIFLKSTVNHVEHFIIQDGADWDNPTYLSKPICHKDLLDKDEIISLDELKDFIKHKFYCEKFEAKKFQEKLFNYHILPFNLHEDENNTEKYAEILKSFSAGKEFQWKESNSLKKFLFGEKEYQKIKEEYENGIKQIEKKYESSYRNDKDIEIAVKRGKQVQELALLKRKFDDARKENLIANYVFWFFQERKLQKELDVINKESLRTDIEIALLDFEQKALYRKTLQEEIKKGSDKQIELEKVNKEITLLSKINFTELKQKAENKRIAAFGPYSNLQEIKKILEDFDSLDELRKQYDVHLKKSVIIEFQNSLKGKSKLIPKINWLIEFENSFWVKNYSNGENEYQSFMDNSNQQIKHLEGLMAFSNYSNEDSIIKWAIDNKDDKYKFNKVQESVIAYFYDKLVTRPPQEEGARYIPTPEELIASTNNIQIKDKDQDGFWLNLGGIYEFIRFRENYFLDKDKTKLIEEINKFSAKIEREIQVINEKKVKLKMLRDILAEYPNRDVFSYYTDKEMILLSKHYKCLDNISTCSDLEAKISDYLNEEKVIKDFEIAEKEKQRIEENEKSLGKLNTIRDELLKYLNANKQDEKQNEINSIEKEIQIITQSLQTFQENECYNKISIDLSNEIKRINEYSGNIFEIWKSRITQREKNKKNVDDVQKELNYATGNFEKSKTECALEHIDINVMFLRDKYKEPPETIQGKTFVESQKSFEDYYNFLVRTYFDDNIVLKNSLDYGLLVQKLIPQIFKNIKFEEGKVIDEVELYLRKINDLSKEINSVFVQLLSERFQDVISTYNEYKRKYERIRMFFSQEGTRITGGHKVKLAFEKAENFPISFLEDVKSELNNEMSYTKGMFLENLPKRKDIEEKIFEIYRKHAKVYNPSVTELLNPLSYFSMSFSMESVNGKLNKGSTGQNYAAIALLCVAQMSEIYKNKRNEAPKGIRLMPLDDAQDLGGNYDMLYTIAKEEDYQIITMSISPLDNLEINNQNWYMLNENPDYDEINYPPFAVLSSEKETIYDWEGYINKTFNEKSELDRT